MKRLIALLCLAACHALAPAASVPASPRPERDAVLDAARPIAERMAGQPVKFRMALFNIDASWALIFGKLVSPAGGDLDWTLAKGCDPHDDKSMMVLARKIDDRWTIKDIDICDGEPAYWHVDELDKLGFPCDLYRGLEVAGAVNPLSPLEQCKGYREKRLAPPTPEAAKPCEELATEIVRSDRATPLIDTDSIERVATWRAASCGEPPIGDGQVVALCNAKTKDGGHVFYWKKRLKGELVNGLATCP